MPRGRFTVDEVLRQVLADSDSEEEDMQLSSEAETDVSSDSESAHHSPQSAHGIADASPQCGRGGSILRTPSRGRGRGGRGAHNTANVGECSGDENNRGCRGRRGRSRGKKHTANGGGGDGHCRTVNHGGDDNDDDGWQFSREEEEYQKWIRNFDEPVGYCGDDLTNSEPIDFISLHLSFETKLQIS